jgi:hypothetical protein
VDWIPIRSRRAVRTTRKHPYCNDSQGGFGFPSVGSLCKFPGYTAIIPTHFGGMSKSHRGDSFVTVPDTSLRKAQARISRQPSMWPLVRLSADNAKEICRHRGSVMISLPHCPAFIGFNSERPSWFGRSQQPARCTCDRWRYLTGQPIRRCGEGGTAAKRWPRRLSRARHPTAVAERPRCRRGNFVLSRSGILPLLNLFGSKRNRNIT